MSKKYSVMIYCGLKLTHDSTVAVFDNNRLLFSIELEKVNNNNRYKIIDDDVAIESILLSNGMHINDIDKFIVDGWYSPGNTNTHINVMNDCLHYRLPVANYHENILHENLLTANDFTGLPVGHHKLAYSSYTHAAGHVFSAYCTSGFAKKKQDALVLVWDGGMYPRLYYFHAKNGRLQNLGELFYLAANIYSIFLQNYGPFRINENVIKDELSVAGKVMAYVAYGQRNEAVIRLLHAAYQTTLGAAQQREKIPEYPFLFSSTFKRLARHHNFHDEDIITSFHFFIEELLLNGLKQMLQTHRIDCSNLCICGGAALNIKWNSAIRNCGLFNEVWVPPFPNDSGSAIGAVCTHLVASNISLHIDWNVYAGPSLIGHEGGSTGWVSQRSDIDELAWLLHTQNEPVILLHGRSELGPRSLGNRSIIAPAGSGYMKDVLNKIKYREDYRPIAPICIESKASRYFSPGCKDPYMLFDHSIRDEWKDSFPAICHHDGTARLQTVSEQDNPLLFALLESYEKLSGHPVLCNTSANFKGCGFFPNVSSAMRWNKVSYIWADGWLFTKNKQEQPAFQKLNNEAAWPS